MTGVGICWGTRREVGLEEGGRVGVVGDEMGEGVIEGKVMGEGGGVLGVDIKGVEGSHGLLECGGG